MRKLGMLVCCVFGFWGLNGCDPIEVDGGGPGGGDPSAGTCSGAEGEKGVAFDNPVGVSLPEHRSCLVTTYTKVIQSSKGEIVPSGMVIDASGNIYFTGRTKAHFDTTYGDIFVAQMKADGSLGWFKTYGSDKKDGFAKDGVYDPSSGNSAMIAIDSSDNLYVAANYTADSQGILLKISAAGTGIWAKSVAHELPGKHHPFHSVSIEGGVAHVAGKRGLYAFSTSDGSYLGGYVMGASRTLAVKATSGAIYAGGWNGWVGDDDGFLVKLTYSGGTYTNVWEKRIPLTKGSKVAAVEIGSNGGVYVGVNHAGALKLPVELQKWDASGSLTWVRQYGASQKAKLDVLRVVGDQILVGGGIHHAGSATFSEGAGEGLLLLVNQDGTLAKEHYYFTGTNPASIDNVKGAAVHNGTLYVAMAHWKSANYGEWRNPNDYSVLEHPWRTVPLSEYLIQDAAFGHDDMEVNSVDASGEWKDVTSNVVPVEAAAGVLITDTAATYFSAIPNYVKSSAPVDPPGEDVSDSTDTVVHQDTTTPPEDIGPTEDTAGPQEDTAVEDTATTEPDTVVPPQGCASSAECIGHPDGEACWDGSCTPLFDAGALCDEINWGMALLPVAEWDILLPGELAMEIDGWSMFAPSNCAFNWDLEFGDFNELQNCLTEGVDPMMADAYGCSLCLAHWTSWMVEASYAYGSPGDIASVFQNPDAEPEIATFNQEFANCAFQ